MLGDKIEGVGWVGLAHKWETVTRMECGEVLTSTKTMAGKMETQGCV